MQSDFHYQATCAMARLAGFGAGEAQRIATAAQFVDEAVETEQRAHPDGARFYFEATAHRRGLQDLAELRDPLDQIRVWVPFHFLPGGCGQELSERLGCRPASAPESVLARAVMDHAVAHVDRVYGLEMLGVTAHVIADTFAHQGFSGVSSRRNRVDAGSLSLENGERFAEVVEEFFSARRTQGGLLENFRPALQLAGQAAEHATGALGHGAVATCPDQPYLRWSFAYERQDLVTQRGRVQRDNPAAFFEACEALHGLFRRALARGRVLGAPAWMEPVQGLVRDLLGVRGDREERGRAWSEAAGRGLLDGRSEPLPPYLGDAWRRELDALAGMPAASAALESSAYRFELAAARHRDLVLHDLLPASGIVLT